MSRTRILVVDDHPLVREGVRVALERADDLELVAEAERGRDVLPLVRRYAPDLVLLDLRLPGIDGLTCLELLTERHPTVKVVVLSGFDDPEHVDAALKRGACSYVAKTVNPLDLPSAIRQAVEGTVFNVVHVAGEAGGPLLAGLTERESTILSGVARGLSNRAIAKEVWVTEQTVKFHLTNIYRKLGVRNRTEAAAVAYRLGIGTNPSLEGVRGALEARAS